MVLTDRRLLTRAAWLMAIMGAGGFLRLWDLGRIGFNSDEAVYTGQAAALAGNPHLQPLFPVFRAHPLLFQVLLSLVLRTGTSDIKARMVAAAFGIATILVVYLLGKLLYGAPVGMVSAAIMAVTPYGVVVSRQVLLDGPMAFFATVTLYCLARYCLVRDPRWLYAAGAMMGLTILAKETAALLLVAIFEFFALVRTRRPRWREWSAALLIMIAVVAVYVAALVVAHRTHTGEQYFLWQSARPANHSYGFYIRVVPPAVGWGVIALAFGGAAWTWRSNGWREGLLLTWVLVPAAVFSLVVAIKGFQYLEFIAPALSVLAARTVVLAPVRHKPRQARLVQIGRAAVGALLLVSLAITSWQQLNPAPTTSFLAGSGGLPGGRETGYWVDGHVPQGGQLLTIGPSMANVIQFYGHRRTLALSVSPNPLDRNPSYEPVDNPDQQLRQGNFQYLVWDTFSAHRSPTFSSKLLSYVSKYHGVAVYTQLIPVRQRDGHTFKTPVIVIYEVIST
ncbi:MAG TPA: glycosyltransferase family 39 protein [Candidatus Saccharimonadia bacterium]